jgi:hypothetical protein
MAKAKKTLKQVRGKKLIKSAKKIVRKVAKKVVKKTVKKTSKKVAVKKVVKKATIKKADGIKVQKPIGKVTHFYTHIKVGIVKFKQPVKTGTLARFKGATTDFVQTLDSLQYDHKPIKLAPKGKLIGLKVKKRVRPGDLVFLEK